LSDAQGNISSYETRFYFMKLFVDNTILSPYNKRIKIIILELSKRDEKSYVVYNPFVVSYACL
jgi:hypothetical protein